jgi:uncharacterized protein (TIGR02677 family)
MRVPPPEGTSEPVADLQRTSTYPEVLDDATPTAGVDPHDLGISDDELRRLKAFRYLSSPDRPLYLVIMRLFTSVLLAEWSAQDVADKLAAEGVVVDADIVDTKLKQLVTWGNLLPSPREVRVTSIAEYHRQSARFQVSKLGTEVQRAVDETLAAAEGAREVSRELLALVSRGLDELATIAGREGAVDAEDVAGRVSNLFLQFGDFAASISDFYAYVGSVVSRFDLNSDEFNGFKGLLLDYLESVVGEVALHTPAVEQALSRLWPNLPALLAVLEEHGAEFRALQEAQPGANADRARGRGLRDWEELRAWFSEDGSTSGAYQLRSAATRALSALLANLKRINAATSRATSHRRDLLKLARWFTDSTPEEAHTLFNAAFAMHGARHLGVALGDDGHVDPDLVPATTPWWKAPTAPVPVSLRERGDRAARGRSSKPIDYDQQKQLLLARHDEVRRARQAACDELAAAAPRLGSVRISAAAMEVLVELFASATAAGTLDLAEGRTRFEAGSSTVDETGLVLTVRRDQGRTTTVRSAIGEITLIDLALDLTATGAVDVRREQA